MVHLLLKKVMPWRSNLLTLPPILVNGADISTGRSGRSYLVQISAMDEWHDTGGTPESADIKVTGKPEDRNTSGRSPRDG